MIPSSQIGGKSGAKTLMLPVSPGTFDQILLDDWRVGLAIAHGYTFRLGHVTSIGWADEDMQDGTQVELLWGDPDGGAANPAVGDHTQTRVRATLHTSARMS